MEKKNENCTGVSQQCIFLITFSDPGEIKCEPDEYAQLVQDLKDSGLIKDQRKGCCTVKKSFQGKEFVDWIVKTKGLGNLIFIY